MKPEKKNLGRGGEGEGEGREGERERGGKGRKGEGKKGKEGEAQAYHGQDSGFDPQHLEEMGRTSL